MIGIINSGVVEGCRPDEMVLTSQLVYAVVALQVHFLGFESVNASD